MPQRRLIAAVYVKDPATHEDRVLLPDESLTPEIAALVTNPAAWDTPPYDGDEPEPIAVGEPDPSGPGTEEGDVSVRKPSSRRARPSSA